ncbi:MAG TPA: hypothetical protein VFS58_01645 [Steroidobacteraceae bacterium]|nr:hypothetical protein [Steroidobacteraceae bacterium]
MGNEVIKRLATRVCPPTAREEPARNNTARQQSAMAQQPALSFERKYGNAADRLDAARTFAEAALDEFRCGRQFLPRTQQAGMTAEEFVTFFQSIHSLRGATVAELGEAARNASAARDAAHAKSLAMQQMQRAAVNGLVLLAGYRPYAPVPPESPSADETLRLLSALTQPGFTPDEEPMSRLLLGVREHPHLAVEVE